MMPSGVCSESKTAAIIREIVIPLKKQLGWEKISNKMLLDYDNFGRYLDIPSLAERCVGIVGDLEVLCEDGYDFDDYSDLKTCSSVWYENYVTDQVSTTIDIKSVSNKQGALRVIVEHNSKLAYFYIPHRYIKHLVSSKSNKGSIRATISRRYGGNTRWNKQYESGQMPRRFYINKLDPYRVPSFTELATITGENTWFQLYGGE